ncbi:MAG TPA: hypothetical protein PKL41_14270, partial [Flavobacteriales bacterium]|nr:hypothetical protein [Flavobacteriales bacterium]
MIGQGERLVRSPASGSGLFGGDARDPYSSGRAGMITAAFRLSPVTARGYCPARLNRCMPLTLPEQAVSVGGAQRSC